jgi:hypothetical protein
MSHSLACNRNIQCRTFDYDSSSRVCRLFEGALETGYTVSAAPTSRVGSVQYLSIFFNAFQQPCSQCTEDRYLTCLNNTCQCPLHSFWNGSQCENQRYENESCLNDEWCRHDPFGLVCSVANVCISKTLYRWTLGNLNLNIRENDENFSEICSARVKNSNFQPVD